MTQKNRKKIMPSRIDEFLATFKKLQQLSATTEILRTDLPFTRQLREMEMLSPVKRFGLATDLLPRLQQNIMFNQDARLKQLNETIRRLGEKYALSVTVPGYQSQSFEVLKQLRSSFNSSLTMDRIIKSAQQTATSKLSYTFSDLFTLQNNNAHTLTLSALLNLSELAHTPALSRYRDLLNTNDSIGSILEQRYGLIFHDDTDNTDLSVPAVIPPVPKAFKKLPPDKALEKREVQKWLARLRGNARKIVYAFFINWFVMNIIAGIGNDLLKETITCYVLEGTVDECSPRQLRKDIQGVIAPENQWNNLKNFRLVSRKDVYLRTQPSESAPVTEMLPVNTLLLVLDKSNRQWIEVETEYGGETIRGWISRRYTLPLHRH